MEPSIQIIAARFLALLGIISLALHYITPVVAHMGSAISGLIWLLSAAAILASITLHYCEEAGRHSGGRAIILSLFLAYAFAVIVTAT